MAAARHAAPSTTSSSSSSSSSSRLRLPIPGVQLPVPQLLLLLLACAQPSLSAQLKYDGVIEGTVVMLGDAPAVVTLYCGDGSQRRSFVGGGGHSNGAFRFTGVPAGSHLLQAAQMGYYFPEVRVEVSAKKGLVKASMSGNKKTMAVPLPLLIRPISEMIYYEQRKPIDLWSIIKSPYGLMIVVSIFFIVVMPRMKVDPEEFKEMQSQLRGGSSGGGAGTTTSHPQPRITSSR